MYGAVIDDRKVLTWKTYGQLWLSVLANLACTGGY